MRPLGSENQLPRPRSSELRLPLVPSTAPARVLVWTLLALCVSTPLLPLGAPLQLEIVRSADGCVLGEPGDAAPCPCAELPGPLRRLLGLPIPLNRASVADLEALPGIGPVRAQAIFEERARGGAFERVDDLVRVRGLGPGTVARLRQDLFVGEPDPACSTPWR